MKICISSSLLIATTFFCSQSHALALSEYNLIVVDDYSHSSSVWGKTFVGGNLQSNGGEFATRLQQDSFADTVKVLGDVSGSPINVMAGNLTYGGELSANVNHNGGGSSIGGQSEAISAERDSIVKELTSASVSYKNLDESGSFSRQGNNAIFNYDGAESTAVFNVNAADIFTQNSLIQLNAGNSETVIINVSTESFSNQLYDYDFVSPTGVNFGNGFQAESNTQNLGASNILWNFFDATSLALQDLKLNGSLLALNADILSIGTTNGSIAAKSLIQDSQIHNYLFNTPTVVPLPASLQFMLMGLGGIFIFRKKMSRSNNA